MSSRQGQCGYLGDIVLDIIWNAYLCFHTGKKLLPFVFFLASIRMVYDIEFRASPVAIFLRGDWLN